MNISGAFKTRSIKSYFEKKINSQHTAYKNQKPILNIPIDFYCLIDTTKMFNRI